MDSREASVESRSFVWNGLGSTAEWRRFVLPCFLLLTLVCYWRILDTFFVQDDFFMLSAAQQSIPNAEMLRGSCFFRPLSSYWLPLLNVSLWGLDSFWHHAVLLVLFLATIGIFYAVLYGLTRSRPAALAGSVLYAFSKTHLYTLAWIAGGIDISAAFFFVIGLWAANRYLTEADNGKEDSPIFVDPKMGTVPEGRANRRLLWTVGIALGCGLLCKESCVPFVPACLVWVIGRKIAGKRPFQSAERRLGFVLIAVMAAYLPLWKIAMASKNVPSPGYQFDGVRGLTVLLDSVIAVLPRSESVLPRTGWWLALPLAFIALAFWNRRGWRAVAGNVLLGISLWTLPAAIFIFTKYPWQLQLYYAHFSVIGLAILAALAIESVLGHVGKWRSLVQIALPFWRHFARAVICVALAFSAAWIGMAGWTIRDGIRRRMSPALIEADFSKAAYDQLNVHLQDKPYQKIVFLDVSELMWASMQYGHMIPVCYPGLAAKCDGRDGFKASRNVKTDSTTLVVRQTGPMNFTVVR